MRQLSTRPYGRGMGVKFFGTFLVEEGVVNTFQLRQATEHSSPAL